MYRPAPQVAVVSLAAANKTRLLNRNITKVVPAPVAVQYIASGRQYNITPADNNTAFNGTPYAGGPKGVATPEGVKLQETPDDIQAEEVHSEQAEQVQRAETGRRMMAFDMV